MAPLFSLAGFGGGIASKLLGGLLQPFATGGTELEPGDGFKYHVFLSPGDFVVNAAGGEVTYLIVGGGGGSGGSGKLNPPNIPSFSRPFAPNYKGYSGGGGAGGLLTGTSELSDTTTYPITVGTGGAGGPRSNSPSTAGGPLSSGRRGSRGGSSTFNSLTALGGGGGGGYTAYGTGGTPYSGKPGGSGGGAGARRALNPIQRGIGGPAPDPSQGNAGGPWVGPVSWPNLSRGGGGGGAGGAGGPGGHPDPSVGGAALAVPAFPAPAILPAIPAPVQSSWEANVGPTGLYSKGGPGGFPTSPTNGVDYTGMGGRGASTNDSTINNVSSYAGGDGIVIIKYPDSY